MRLYQKDDIDSHTNVDLFFAHLGLLDMALRDLQDQQPQRAAQCLRRYVVLERARRAHRCNDYYADRDKKLRKREQALKQQLQAAIEQYCHPASQCACVHPDARTCFEIRYPAQARRYGYDFQEECTCGCHYEYDYEGYEA